MAQPLARLSHWLTSTTLQSSMRIDVHSKSLLATSSNTMSPSTQLSTTSRHRLQPNHRVWGDRVEIIHLPSLSKSSEPLRISWHENKKLKSTVVIALVGSLCPSTGARQSKEKPVKWFKSKTTQSLARKHAWEKTNQTVCCHQDAENSMAPRNREKTHFAASSIDSTVATWAQALWMRD